MRAREFIREGGDKPNLKDIPPDQAAALKGAMSLPAISMNKSNGSPYMQYRFGIALAGAPEYPTKAAGAFAGDPLLSCYSDAELEMINAAADMVGAGHVSALSTNRSTELDNVNKVSPVPQNSGKKLNRKS